MKLHASDAIILHHLDYGESDRIVTFLTPDDGICKGYARGARNSRKRFGAALDSFAQVRLQWSAPRHGDLLSLSEADLLDLRLGLRSELLTIALATYGCELVEVIGGAHGHPEIFALLAAYLDHLNHSGPTPEARLLLELRLLFHSGYAPHLLHCSACNATLTSDAAAFDASRGGSLCCACAPAGRFRPVALGTLGALSRISRTPLDRFDGFRLGPRTLSEGGQMLADALRVHLHRPLKSLTFLEQL